MMHQQIEDDEVIERYVRNQLGAEERKAFEEHYFSCEDCFEKVQSMERFVAGIRDAAGRGLLRENAPSEAPAWRFAPFWTPLLGACTLGLLLVVIAGGSWYYLQLKSVRGDLRASTTELQRERQARAALAQQLALTSQAEPNVPLVMLQSTRDVQAQPAETILPAGAAHLVLWMDVPASHFNSYRLELYGADETPVEKLEHLSRNAYGALAASIPANQLQSGEFRIKLYGENPSPAILLAEYRFKISKP